jgi:hypothetical protein
MSRRTARSLALESLEDRLALSATPAMNPLESLVTAKGGDILGSMYVQYTNYVQGGSQGQFSSTLSGVVETAGPTVGIDARLSGNFSSNLSDLQAVGMVVTATVPSQGLIEGFMPLAQLPAVAMDPNLTSLSPVLRPTQAPQVPHVTVPATPSTPTPTPTSGQADVTAIASKGGQVLASMYQQFLNFEAAGGSGTFTPTGFGSVMTYGGAVGVQLTTSSANLSSEVAQLGKLGVLVTGTSSTGQTGIINAVVPIASLPAVASDANVFAMSPILRPKLF